MTMVTPVRLCPLLRSGALHWSAVMGYFTPWKSANATGQGLVYCFMDHLDAVWTVVETKLIMQVQLKSVMSMPLHCEWHRQLRKCSPRI